MNPLPSFRDPRKTNLGSILTVHDLPKAGEYKRWTPLKKAIIAEAIKKSVISPQEVCARYSMSAAELKRWIDLLDNQGVRGLLANNFAADHMPENVDNVSFFEDGPLSINFGTKTVRLAEQFIYLTPNQFRLLSILVLRAPNAVTREDVYTLLYKGQREPQVKILDVMVCKMRKHLGDSIETVWGRGWRYNKQGVSK